MHTRAYWTWMVLLRYRNLYKKIFDCKEVCIVLSEWMWKRGSELLFWKFEKHIMFEQSAQKLLLPFPTEIHIAQEIPKICSRYFFPFSLVFASWRESMRKRVSEHRIQYVLNSSNNKVANRLSILLPKSFRIFYESKTRWFGTIFVVLQPFGWLESL